MKFARIWHWPFLLCFYSVSFAQNIPLPEHPRPDFERPEWQNLNGSWQFALDSLDLGLQNNWQSGNSNFNQKITVPFPWGSPLSGIADKADIGWYRRTISVDPAWKNKRTFLTIGASDWETTAWLDGHLLGTHQGGYTPFSFELTPYLKVGSAQQLVIRADDKRRDFTLYGKQGYGNARGIWQTVYLEARGTTFLDAVHFTPHLATSSVTVNAYLPTEAEQDQELNLSIKTEGSPVVAKAVIPKGQIKAILQVPIPNPHRWTLDDPYLYEVEIKLGEDVVHSYFGMREISVVNLPGTEFPYVALNGKPVYLQLTLDQSYHPEGFYTFPSDEFMKNEIARAKGIGLNGIRTHIKIDIPRKLYWADKLGLFVMSDLPNSWGDPDAQMQAEAERTLREMIKRDYNHPAIFSWIVFNETWGLFTHFEENGKRVGRYLPTTQNWVASMYYLAKSLDSSRLVEDNSICCGAGHTQTDINSFHDYLPGWQWEAHLKDLTEKSFPGSTFQFEPGFVQGHQPKINSECGNVWGYDGSTGDVDWSWDYHRMMNSFREFPEVAGWLYTEHHDVINEWNGYWRFDRTNKFTGLEEIMPGMSLNDMHAPIYLSTGNEICLNARGGDQVSVPLILSSMTDKEVGSKIRLVYELSMTNTTGETKSITSGSKIIDYLPYMQKILDPLVVTLPNTAGVALLTLKLESTDGKALHHNFVYFEVSSTAALPNTTVISLEPTQFSKEQWSQKQWNVMEGRKVNGAGKGYFEYSFPITETPTGKACYFVAELSAKQLFVKDRGNQTDQDFDYMLGAKDAPSRNPNAYPMTDETKFTSMVDIIIDGEKQTTVTLADDPADHRGVLSWHHQLQDGKLREAGSYGYLVKVPVSKKALKNAQKTGHLTVRLQTQGEGGIAIYGREFGRYPVNPSLIFIAR